jgi:hypothetical protein
VTFDNTGPVLAWENGTFLRAGRPHRILSGSLHYFRVHPDLWSDRLRRLAAMGLNTVDTYVAWNFHEYKEGDVSFDEWRDLPRFIALAADHGLDVIVRPGPYICAEWDNGGLPAWLTARCAVPRSSDSVFTEAVAAWFDQLLPQITDLQASAGGPIVAVQLRMSTEVMVTITSIWAGANHDGSTLQPTVTSYDSDAPIAENGALTDKFHALRDVFAPGQAVAPHWFDAPTVVPPAVVDLQPRGELLPTLRQMGPSRSSVAPESFESLGQASGLVLYRGPSRCCTQGAVTISIRDLRDRAQVFVDGRPVGILERENAEQGVMVEGHGRPVSLELLVETLGRVNYGPLLGEHKGILGGVQIDRRLVLGWTQVSLDISQWNATRIRDGVEGQKSDNVQADGAGGFYEATLTVDEPAEAFICFPGSTKGFVWVNDFLLGRYWDLGPQHTLYVPAPLLQLGPNRVTVLELEHCNRVLETCGGPDLGPPEEYIEDFG